jgi:hypothetical protein
MSRPTPGVGGCDGFGPTGCRVVREVNASTLANDVNPRTATRRAPIAAVAALLILARRNTRSAIPDEGLMDSEILSLNWASSRSRSVTVSTPHPFA